MLSANSVVNAFSKLKLAQNAFQFPIVPYDQFEHLPAFRFSVLLTWQYPLQHSLILIDILMKLLHFLRPYAFSTYFEGELQSLGFSLISAYINKGENVSHKPLKGRVCC